MTTILPSYFSSRVIYKNWFKQDLNNARISLGGYSSKIRKVSTCRPTVSNETNLAPSVQVCRGGKGVEKSVIKYLGIKWMTPNNCWGVFFMHWIRISAKNTGSRFSWRKFLHKSLFKTTLWHEIDNSRSYFLIFSKYSKWKQDYHTDTFWNYLVLDTEVWLSYISRWGRDRDNEHWWATIVWWATADTMRRNLQYLAVVIQRHNINFCVKEMKEKSSTFCLPKLKAKKKANFSKIIGGWVTFLWRILVFSFKVNLYLLSFLLKL